jgi:hypothetical protein
VRISGLVPFVHGASVPQESDEFGNVDTPPEYGIDIVIHGGDVAYGPWADRQRLVLLASLAESVSDALQKAFAPSIFFDSEPKARLQPGETRIHTALVLNIFLSEATTLRIPTREPSKVRDWIDHH